MKPQNNKVEIQKTEIKSFTDLIVWQKAHQLMLDVYEFVECLPPEEKYARRQPLIRAVSSIAANIAEGFGRFHYQENIQFCRQARGSLLETQNHVLAARDLKQAPLEECDKIVLMYDTVLKLLNGYIASTNRRKIA